MKKTFKSALTLLGTLALAVGLTACGDKNEQTTNQPVSSIEQLKNNDVIRIGVFGDKPPFGYVDSNGQNQGFDIEIAKQLTHKLLGDENKVNFVLVEAANRVEYLQSNKVDIILANFTRTPARQEVVDFAQPYMKVALGVVSKDGEVISDVAQLEGKTLLVNKGTTADTYFTKNYPNLNLLKFEQNTETFEALRDGRGAALAHDNTLLFAWAKENLGYTVGVRSLGELDYIAPAVKKGDTELLNWLNSEIENLSKDGKLLDAYNKTLLPVYGDTVQVDDVVVSY